LPFPIYHQEHERRYDATTENLKYRDAYLNFQSQSQEMLKNKHPKIYNSKNWGFFSNQLEEIIL
jgi:nucleoid-associated protein YejK